MFFLYRSIPMFFLYRYVLFVFVLYIMCLF